MPNDVTNTNAAILTLDSDAVLETAQSKADLIWHDIQNAYRTRKILTGTLGGIEKTEAGNLIAVIYYKEFRAVIPITEMMINLLQDEAHDYGSLSLRQNKVLNNMLGCEIDFIIKGLDINDNIRASREAIVEVLEESHADILSEINAAIAKLPEGDTASINDSYTYNISVNANLLISQFCASQDNYENINLRKLKSLIRKNKDGLFSYDVATETVTMEVVVEGGAEGENSPEMKTQNHRQKQLPLPDTPILCNMQVMHILLIMFFI